MPSLSFRTLALAGLWAAIAFGHAAPPPEKKAEPKPPTMEEMAAELERAFQWEGYDDPRGTLGDLLDHIQSTPTYGFKCQFSYNKAAFYRSGADENTDPPEGASVSKLCLGPGTMNFKTFLRVHIAKALPEAKAGFLLRRHSIEITTEAAIRRELRLPTGKGADAEPLPELVYFHRFNGETLEAACETLAEKMDVTIVLDPRVKEKAATKVKARFVNTPLDVAVEILADTAWLVVKRKANAFYITSPEKAGKATGRRGR
jgi:hypothetical protein